MGRPKLPPERKKIRVYMTLLPETIAEIDRQRGPLTRGEECAHIVEQTIRAPKEP